MASSGCKSFCLCVLSPYFVLAVGWFRWLGFLHAPNVASGKPRAVKTRAVLQAPTSPALFRGCVCRSVGAVLEGVQNGGKLWGLQWQVAAAILWARGDSQFYFPEASASDALGRCWLPFLFPRSPLGMAVLGDVAQRASGN